MFGTGPRDYTFTPFRYGGQGSPSIYMRWLIQKHNWILNPKGSGDWTEQQRIGSGILGINIHQNGSSPSCGMIFQQIPSRPVPTQDTSGMFSCAIYTQRTNVPKCLSSQIVWVSLFSRSVQRLRAKSHSTHTSTYPIPMADGQTMRKWSSTWSTRSAKG